MLKKLFQKFGQVGTNKNHRKIGTGLGLWITHNLCTGMEGDIKAHSQEGEGSVFVAAIKCDIPMTIPPQNEGFQGINESNVSSQIIKKIVNRVLIVDDDVFNCIILKGYLNKLSIESSVVHNGEEALSVVNKNFNTIDLIFMDCEMPKMNGFETSRKIKQFLSKNNLRDIQILGLTAHVSEKVRKEFQQNGVQKILTKPISFQTVQDLVGITKIHFS